MKAKTFSHVRLLATPWTAAYQAPPSMGFSRQEYWSGVPFSNYIAEQMSKGIVTAHKFLFTNFAISSVTLQYSVMLLGEIFHLLV